MPILEAIYYGRNIFLREAHDYTMVADAGDSGAVVCGSGIVQLHEGHGRNLRTNIVIKKVLVLLLLDACWATRRRRLTS